MHLPTNTCSQEIFFLCINDTCIHLGATSQSYGVIFDSCFCVIPISSLTSHISTRYCTPNHISLAPLLLPESLPWSINSLLSGLPFSYASCSQFSSQDLSFFCKNMWDHVVLPWCSFLVKRNSRAFFSSTYTKVEMIRRGLSWPSHKDDIHSWSIPYFV